MSHRRDLETDLEQGTMDYLAKHRDIRVRDLYEALLKGAPQLTEKQLTDLVWRLADDGKVDLFDAKPSSASFGRFLLTWELNLFFYLSLTLCVAAVFVVFVLPSAFPFVVFRWIFGLLFVLFLPGYVAVEWLYVYASLDLFERFAYSVGLSVTFAMFVGLMLNYLPWRITLTPIMVSLTALTVVFDFMALFRRFHR